MYFFSLEENLEKRTHRDSASTLSEREGAFVFMLQPKTEGRIEQTDKQTELVYFSPSGL